MLPVANLDTSVFSSVNSIPNNIYSFDSTFPSVENPDSYHFIDPETIRNIIQKVKSKVIIKNSRLHHKIPYQRIQSLY